MKVPQNQLLMALRETLNNKSTHVGHIMFREKAYEVNVGYQSGCLLFFFVNFVSATCSILLKKMFLSNNNDKLLVFEHMT